MIGKIIILHTFVILLILCLNTVECRKRKLIIHGKLAHISDLPFLVQVIIVDKVEEPLFFCGGTIISEENVLTAAHCVVDLEEHRVYEPREVEVISGASVKFQEDGNKHKVKRVLAYDRENDENDEHLLDHDIALLWVVPKFTFGPKVKRAQLAKSNDWMKSDDITLTVAGWGSITPVATDEDDDDVAKKVNYKLFKTTVTMFPPEQCDTFNHEPLGPAQICLGSEEGHDTCQGDSGGPVILGRRLLVGITSYGDGCGFKPGVYTNVHHFHGWVKHHIKKHARHHKLELGEILKKARVCKK